VSYCESRTEDQPLEAGPGKEQQPLLRKMTPLVKGNQILTGVAELERVGKGWEHVYGIRGKLDPRMSSTSCHSLSPPFSFGLDETAQPHLLERRIFIDSLRPYIAQVF
jgi:hypothetical protein